MYREVNDENDSIDHIFFSKSEKSNTNDNKIVQTRPNINNDCILHCVSLLSKFCGFCIFDVIPKLFTISTKNNSYHFNCELLKDSSSVIFNQLQENPSNLQYYLNIEDEEKVMGKFEELYNGHIVIFNEDELPSSQQITKILQIRNCPDYLKPESLRNNTIDLNFFYYQSNSNDLGKGVEIDQDSLEKFLLNKQFQSFRIITKRKIYKCNIFGVHSSKIIHGILAKDPSINQYIFDFEDEFDEFQLICDIFNFKSVDITRNNMYLLKEIAEDLQINSILNQIDNYICKYEKISQNIDEQEMIIDSIDMTFDWLYKIQELTIKNVKNFIIQSKWVESEESVQELAAFILQVIKVNFRIQYDIADLLIQLNAEANEFKNLSILIPFIIHKLLYFYMPNHEKQIQKINENNKKYFIYQQPIDGSLKEEDKFVFMFIRILYKKGIIKKEEIIKKLKNYNSKNKNIIAFFLPEIIEVNHNCMDMLLNNSYLNSIVDNLPNKIELYEKMLEKGESDDEITKYLRLDDVDNLQSFIMRYQIDIEEYNVPHNIFDDFSNDLNLINYSALYGSIKCFKYLLLNNSMVDFQTLYFAVYGGNIEIIKIVNQKCMLSDNSNYNETQRTYFHRTIKLTISQHKNEIFDWIINQDFFESEKNVSSLTDLVYTSAINGNAHSIIEIIDNGLNITPNLFTNIIKKASKNGFYSLAQLLMNFIAKNPKNDTTIVANFVDCNFKFSIKFGNISICKLFTMEMERNNFETVILNAIELDYTKIMQYYFDNIVNKKFMLTDLFVKHALTISLKKNTDNCLNYLIEKFQLLSPQILTFKLYTKLLSNSCLYGNLAASKILTEIILKNDKKYDFSASFIKASSSNSQEICKYFLEKDLYINYETLSHHVPELGFISAEIFSAILKNVKQNLKKKFLKCINSAIEKRNKNLVEFLLKEKAIYKNALLDAVSINDFEMVELILNYDSSSLFVNKNTEKGTALLIAVKNNNLKIVKRLLSIPGIDPNIYNKNNEFPITVAISNKNLEIFDAILNFYGDNIISNIWLLNHIMLSISKHFTDNLNVEKSVFDILNRILQIKSIDPNFVNQNTFLYKACYHNKIEIVELLIEFDEIDVNKYDINSGNTPLMISLINNNINIAKILISYPKTNINFRNHDNETALTIAVKNEQSEIIDLLINDERFNPVESCLNYSFYISNNEISSQLLELNTLDVNYAYDKSKDKNNHNYDYEIIYETSLIKSVNNGNIEKIDMIINHSSFDINRSKTYNAIKLAICNNNITIFEKLFDLLEDDIYNLKYKTPLELAALNSNIEIIKIIFNHPKFNPNCKQIVDAFVDSYNNRIHDVRIIETMKLILDFDREHAHIIDFKKLLENGKSFFTVIEYKKDILGEISDFLLEQGVDPNEPDKDDEYPFEKAIFLESFSFVNSMIKSNKIDLQKKIKGKTYLHFAAKNISSEILKYLLDFNVIDINSVDSKGKTPLFYACKYQSVDCVKLLFEYDNLDYLHLDNKGKDALKTLKNLSRKEYNCAISSKDNYLKKIIAIIKKLNNDNSNDNDENDDEQNNFYEYDDDEYNEEESEKSD